MAANTLVSGPRGERVQVGGTRNSVITAAETNQLATKSGRVSHVVISGDDAGTTCIVTVYDSASASSNQIWRWVTADGKGTFPIQLPFQNGLKVIVAGTPPTNGGIDVVWEL